MPAPTRRAQDIEPFRVMAILARARELQARGHDIVHMEVGEPDFPTPPPAMSASPTPPPCGASARRSPGCAAA